MPIAPTPKGLTHALGAATPKGQALVSQVDVDGALQRLGLAPTDLRDAAAAVNSVLSQPDKVAVIEQLATEALSAWETVTPVRYFPDGDDDDQALVLAVLVTLQPLAEQSLRAIGVSEATITKTLATTGSQVRLFRQMTGRLGVESGWWQIYGLMGGFIEVGELHAHRIELGTHLLGPDPWLSVEHQQLRGEGFFEGDEAIGLHIPHGADLSATALAETLEVLTREVAVRWPTEKRRIVSIQTWMLDRQLAPHLDPTSRILTFQAAFEPLDLHAPNDDLTRRLVFGADTEPANPTRLQRVLQQLWDEGSSSRWEVGVRLLA